MVELTAILQEDVLQLAQTKLALDEAVAGEDNEDEKVETQMKSNLMNRLRTQLAQADSEEAFIAATQVPLPASTIISTSVDLKELSDEGMAGSNTLGTTTPSGDAFSSFGITPAGTPPTSSRASLVATPFEDSDSDIVMLN